MSSTDPAKRFGNDLRKFGEQIEQVVDDLYPEQPDEYRQDVKERLLTTVAAELVDRSFTGAEQAAKEAKDRKPGKW